MALDNQGWTQKHDSENRQVKKKVQLYLDRSGRIVRKGIFMDQTQGQKSKEQAGISQMKNSCMHIRQFGRK